MVQHTERADARANRARLIEAAQQVFRERGLDAEMKEIAERAGVGIGTIYRNFPKKDDLIAAIMRDVFDAMMATLNNADTIADPGEALRSLLRDGLAVTERFGDMLEAMMAGHLPPDCKIEFEGLGGVERIAAIVRRGIAAGQFRAEVDADVAALRLIASFMPWQYRELRRTRTHEQIVAAHLDQFMHGITR